MDVKQILDSKHIPYVSKGRDYTVRCLNPQHEDKNPSMNIDKLSGVFHCYSCGFAGNIYDHFKIKNDKLINQKIERAREKVLSLLNNKSLPMPLDAVYIDKDFRDISVSTLRKFRAFTSDTLMEGRIIFPITNITNDIVAFQGRYMYSDLEPKYKVYPEHTTLNLFPSVVEPINNSIILVEGLFDMLNLHDKGLSNAVCTFGTAFGSVKAPNKKAINRDKLLQYKYQGIEKIYIMYDGDRAGRNASSKLMNYINDMFIVDELPLGDGEDPGNLSEKYVKKIYEDLNEQRSSSREVS